MLNILQLHHICLPNPGTQCLAVLLWLALSILSNTLTKDKMNREIGSSFFFMEEL